MPGLGESPRVTMIGAGMIAQVQILPSLYQLQRDGVVGEIHVCDARARFLKNLAENEGLRKAFPGQGFVAHPDPATTALDEPQGDLYKQVFAEAPKGSIAVVAVPDQFHYAIVKEALLNDLNVCVVKPLVLKYAQAEEIAALAYERGLVVGIEYHKRFDHRALLARRKYRDGKFGEFKLAQAQMIEPFYYFHSNFQNWCTVENSDMFTYVGCHYVDQVAFITGLRPVSVSVYGIVDEYPNGNKGYLWTDGRVIWENGACLSVVDAMGYPNAAAGGNYQGLAMWGKGKDDATLLFHSDQYRGVKHSYTEAGTEPGDTVYTEPNPDYFQLLDLGGGGLTPVGYGHRSVEYIVKACRKGGAMAELDERRAYVRRLDEEGIMATPANSSYNELVVEAGRKSIQAGGREVVIQYEPVPRIAFREYV
ncbi:MAG: Gfo/Idh/MocA family oxidoreductase [FCB group bacterium]|nr:Gfo/Idh/MocA family oxidoreductase [FCB group bacterium]